MNSAVQILRNSGLGDKGAGLTPEQDITLRAAPSIGLAVQSGHGTSGALFWLCRVERGFPPISGGERIFQGRVVACSPSSALPLPCPWP